jgi:hypothetical protein
MTSIIGQNQTISSGLYTRSVADACSVPHDFLMQQAARIDRAYAAGETVAMIAEEMQFRFSMRRTAPTKTPRQLAARVVPF